MTFSVLFSVRPDYVRVTEKDENTSLISGETLGPINEGKTITLRCESGEGKPVPTVEWFNDDDLLEGRHRFISISCFLLI